MSITVNDPDLLAKLTTTDQVEIKDPLGETLGIFVPMGLGAPSAGSPVAVLGCVDGGTSEPAADGPAPH